jgi:Caspase domain
MRSANLAVGVLCALTLSLTPAAAKRVALVVGIDTYDNFSPDLQLKKAVNDARAVSATFKDLGFQVITAENTKRDGFLKAW